MIEVEFPAHIVEDDAEAATEGTGVTVTVTWAVLTHPLAPVPVTV